MTTFIAIRVSEETRSLLTDLNQKVELDQECYDLTSWFLFPTDPNGYVSVVSDEVFDDNFMMTSMVISLPIVREI